MCTYNNISIVGYMKHKQRVTRSGKKGPAGDEAAPVRGGTAEDDFEPVGVGRRIGTRPAVSMQEVMEFYKPIKKPVTLRLDADVLAWFRRDGRL